MNRLVVVFVLALGLQVPAVAQLPTNPAAKPAVKGVSAEKAAVMAPIHQFVDGFNKGDVTSALGACAEEIHIIDEFAPYEWKGLGACSTWATDYDTDAKKKGITDGVVTIGTPKHLELVGDRAYVVVPANYVFKQKGKSVREIGAILTITLQKSANGWHMTAWTWAKS